VTNLSQFPWLANDYSFATAVSKDLDSDKRGGAFLLLLLLRALACDLANRRCRGSGGR